MSRSSLVDVLIENLLDRILGGEFAANQILPPEPVLALEAGVSRLTAREAIKALQAQNIVSVKRGLGTFVNPVSSWTGLDAIMRAASRGLGGDEVALRLLEVRRMVEAGSAELAATNHSPGDLDRLDETIADMEAASAGGDLDRLTASDLAFHDAVLAASGNPFLPALMGQLSQLLYTLRRETSAFKEVQEHAITHHKAVRAAISTGDPLAARAAMEAHIQQTLEDYDRYVRAER